MMTAFHNIKHRAKQRGVFFALTFAHFKKFCKQTNYIALKGTSPDSLSVDRVIPRLGYVDGNIQVLSVAANSRKRWEDVRKHGWSVSALGPGERPPF